MEFGVEVIQHSVLVLIFEFLLVFGFETVFFLTFNLSRSSAYSVRLLVDIHFHSFLLLIVSNLHLREIWQQLLLCLNRAREAKLYSPKAFLEMKA